MSRDKTKPKSYRLTPGEEQAIQKLAIAGYVKNPDGLQNRTEVGVLRRMLREAWANCPETRDLPFPDDE